MAFSDALQDTCTVYTVTTVNNNGQQEKSTSALYTDIPCRFMKTGFVSPEDVETAVDNFKGRWTVLLEPSRTGINREDRVTFRSMDYIVSEVREIRGRSSQINHIVLFVEERE